LVEDGSGVAPIGPDDSADVDDEPSADNVVVVAAGNRLFGVAVLAGCGRRAARLATSEHCIESSVVRGGSSGTDALPGNPNTLALIYGDRLGLN